MEGKLYVCGTPIGNLEDITFRVINTLKACDVVYAEDTRHSIRLLNHFEISKPLHSYHEHNTEKAGAEIVQKVKNGEKVVLISDAGMPGISDPGSDLIKLFIDNQLPFEIVPGVTAFSMALVGSGLPTDTFIFEGFLSRDRRQKKKHLERLKQEQRTLIFYESPHRLKDTLKCMVEILGENRAAVVARELTKRFETFERRSLRDLLAYYEAVDVKGEIVLVVEGFKGLLDVASDSQSGLSIVELVQFYMLEGLEKKEAIKTAAKQRNLKKNDIYMEVSEALKNLDQ